MAINSIIEQNNTSAGSAPGKAADELQATTSAQEEIKDLERRVQELKPQTNARKGAIGMNSPHWTNGEPTTSFQQQPPKQQVIRE